MQNEDGTRRSATVDFWVMNPTLAGLNVTPTMVQAVADYLLDFYHNGPATSGPGDAGDWTRQMAEEILQIALGLQPQPGEAEADYCSRGDWHED